MSNQAQGTITIKRLRNGDTLTMIMNTNGKPLYQAVNPDNGQATPDWTKDANRPVLTPVCYTSRNKTVKLENHRWEYNGVALTFNGAKDGSYTKDSTGKFEMDASTGELKIIANIADANNTADDTLDYYANATTEGVTTQVQKSLTIQIQTAGSSSYYAKVTATLSAIDATNTTTTLTTYLQYGTEVMSNYYVKWKKGGKDWTAKNGSKEITVTQDDVDGITTFMAEFYKDSTSTDPVARSAVSIRDNSDEFRIEYKYNGTNTAVDENKKVSLTAYVYSAKKGAEVTTLTNAVWSQAVINGATWDTIRTVYEADVEISTADTDGSDGTVHDVEVVSTVSFD